MTTELAGVADVRLSNHLVLITARLVEGMSTSLLYQFAHRILRLHNRQRKKST